MNDQRVRSQIGLKFWKQAPGKMFGTSQQKQPFKIRRGFFDSIMQVDDEEKLKKFVIQLTFWTTHLLIEFLLQIWDQLPDKREACAMQLQHRLHTAEVVYRARNAEANSRSMGPIIKRALMGDLKKVYIFQNILGIIPPKWFHRIVRGCSSVHPSVY